MYHACTRIAHRQSARFNREAEGSIPSVRHHKAGLFARPLCMGAFVNASWSKMLLRWIDDVSLSALMIFATLVLVLFAVLFWTFGGLSATPPVTSFRDCLYFSVVTFTSLGYGDISPVHYGRLLACLEVVTGLSFMGLVVAKLSSSRQSYYLGQLYARDAQERLEAYVAEIRSVRETYKTIREMQRIGKKLESSLMSYHEAQRLLLRLRAYLSFEIPNGDLLTKTPVGPIAHVLKSCSQLMPLLADVASVPTSLHSQRQRRVATTVVLQALELATMVCKNCEDQVLLSEATGLTKRCDTAREKLHSGSKAVADADAHRRRTYQTSQRQDRGDGTDTDI